MLKNKQSLSLRDKRGFTLIELLVVIAIIAVLSALFVNTASINIKRSRDARRKNDLSEIQAGIETYRSDCNVYPSSITSGSSLVGSGSGNCLSTNKYISAVPQDPIAGMSYIYTSNGTTYQICSTLEVPPTGAVAYTCNGSTACGSGKCYYQVVNP